MTIQTTAPLDTPNNRHGGQRAGRRALRDGASRQQPSLPPLPAGSEGSTGLRFHPPTASPTWPGSARPSPRRGGRCPARLGPAPAAAPPPGRRGCHGASGPRRAPAGRGRRCAGPRGFLSAWPRPPSGTRPHHHVQADPAAGKAARCAAAGRLPRFLVPAALGGGAGGTGPSCGAARPRRGHGVGRVGGPEPRRHGVGPARGGGRAEPGAAPSSGGGGVPAGRRAELGAVGRASIAALRGRTGSQRRPLPSRLSSARNRLFLRARLGGKPGCGICPLRLLVARGREGRVCESVGGGCVWCAPSFVLPRDGTWWEESCEQREFGAALIERGTSVWLGADCSGKSQAFKER